MFGLSCDPTSGEACLLWEKTQLVQYDLRIIATDLIHAASSIFLQFDADHRNGKAQTCPQCSLFDQKTENKNPRLSLMDYEYGKLLNKSFNGHFEIHFRNERMWEV